MSMEAIEKQARELHGEAIHVVFGLRAIASLGAHIESDGDELGGLMTLVETLADRLKRAADEFDRTDLRMSRATTHDT